MKIDLNICLLLVLVGQMVTCREAMDLFNQFSRVNKLVRGQSECLICDHEPLALKAYLSASVLIATALEKFTVYISQPKGRLRTYSVLFRIKKILKYEFGKNASNLFPISDQYSNEISSLIMIENFNEQDLKCHNVDIKLDYDYILFLNAQNTSIEIKKRRQLTFPIRLSILNTQIRLKSFNRQYSKSSIFLRMPVFSKFAKPLLYESVMDRELIYVPRSSIQLTMAEPQVRNGTLHLECNLVGSNLSSILWLKSIQANHVYLETNQKYRIDFSNSKSILEVKNFSNADTAVYSCFTFDYLNGSLSNEKLIYGQANVTASLLNNRKSKIDLDLVGEKKFIACGQEENECKNGGQCLKTNPKYYKNSPLFHLLKTKFCMCKEFYEGPNCEFELLRKIEFNSNEIPDDLKPLWNSLSKDKKI